MDSFEINKIVGAILFVCLVTLGLSIVSEELFHAPEPEQPGYQIAVAEDGEEGAAQEEEGPALPELLASADPAAGEAATRPCQTCHTFEQGGPAKVGPNLYNVVGAPVGHMEGFSYSSAFQELHGAGETWTYERLDEFLANPRSAISGTNMSFAGVRDPQERASIIAYLASITDNPPPMPAPEEETASQGGEQAAEGEQAAAAEQGEDTGGQAAAGSGGEEAGAGEAAQGEQQAATEDGGAGDEEQAAGGGDQAASGDQAGTGGGDAPAGGGSELAAMFSEADPAKGEAAVRVCQACHNFEEGAGNKVGPNLHGVVGRPKASVEGFSYSPAMQEAAQGGGSWTYEELNAFLTNPREHVPGTTMVFPGVRQEDKRADIIAYLASISEGTPPLPGQGGN